MAEHLGPHPSGPADGQDPGLSNRTLVLDDAGNVIEVDGAPVTRATVAELVPGLDAAALARCLALLHSGAVSALKIDVPVPGKPAQVVRMSRIPGDMTRMRLELASTGGDPGYRDRLDQRLAFERLIAALSTELIHAPEGRLDALIEQALGRIGRLFAVDRAYLFQFSADRAFQSNTHEWAEEGISREAEHLQDVPMDHFPWLMAEILAGRAVHVPVVGALPDTAATERAEFIREGIRSWYWCLLAKVTCRMGSSGSIRYAASVIGPPEILLGLELVGQMFFNAFRAREMSESLIRLAFHDPLTGMGNRRFLGEQLTHALDRGRREGAGLAVILIDLDDFKLVNDSYGHSLGDEILKTAASRLAATVRAADIVARLGGDEFVVVAETDGLDTLSQLIERLFEAMLAPVELRGETFSLRMSIGIALCPEDATDAENLLRQADTAMYAAKVEGKNRFAFFTPSMTRDSRAALRLRHDLRLAIERNEIEAYYQPRVALPSLRVIGFEALARWNHPSRGLLLPADFLGLAQRIGVIGRIDLCMLSQAIADLARWRLRHSECRVSVNLDADDLGDRDLIDRLLEMLANAGGAGEGIDIEITESSLMRDIDRSAQTLERLRHAAPGVQIAIDDFGCGYSSLAYLGKLPVTTLKIDRSFITELGNRENPHAHSIIQSIIHLGDRLGLHVVAEGVETPAQAKLLTELGCTEAQGFLFSKAVPAAGAAAMLESGLTVPRGISFPSAGSVPRQ